MCVSVLSLASQVKGLQDAGLEKTVDAARQTGQQKAQAPKGFFSTIRQEMAEDWQEIAEKVKRR